MGWWGASSRLGSPWRYVVALLLIVAGGAHIPLVPDHLREAPYVGVLFILLIVACAVLAVAIVVRDVPVVWWLSGVTAALAIAAFLLSRTVGLPELGDDVGNWTGDPMAMPALLSETATALVAVYVLRGRRGDLHA